MIFPPEYAALCAKHAGAKYRPSNATEGDIFMRAWCCKCERDKSMREGADFDECDDNELCQIIADTHCFDIDHPKYPIQWVISKDGQPCCTAFVPAGGEILPSAAELEAAGQLRLPLPWPEVSA